MTNFLRSLLPIVMILSGGFTSLFGQDYNEIWSLINKNDRSAATDIIEKKLKNNSASIDEFITYYYIRAFDGKEGEIVDFLSRIKKSDNPDAYIYSLWFSAPVAGEYGRKAPYQLALLNHNINAKPGHGTLRASSHYSMGHHYVRLHQFPMIKKENAMIGALSEWQFVGPFNNISGSGFNKNYEPVKDPSNSSVFKSVCDAPIKWFTPIEKQSDGWTFTGHVISESAGNITFAQTFVNSPEEQDVYLCTGMAGNIKVWVNDQLILSVPDACVTEMDAYNSKCHLKKGYNRILVQVGSDRSEPNFIVRLTDNNYDPIKNISSVASPQIYSKVGGESLGNGIPLFAESYFIEKISKDPKNLVNYMLLNRTYLRSKKVFDARKILEKALQIAPGNSLLKYELLLCYLKESNRTGLSELSEYFKENEKSSLISYLFRIEELKNQEKFQEAYDMLEEKIKVYGNDESAYDDKIQLLANLNSIPQLVELSYEAYKKFPHSGRFVNYIFNIESQVNKDTKKALKILQTFLNTHYEYDLVKLLVGEYFKQNNAKKAYALIQEQIDTWPFDPSLRIDMLGELIGQQRYPEALELCNFMLKMKPFSGYYYDNLATVEESMNKDHDAIASYGMAFKYQPTLYRSRDKQRRLQRKTNVLDDVSQSNIEDILSKADKNIKTEDYDFYYLKYETNIILYPEGGREQIHTTALKVLNQRGIDKYKEVSLSYNGNSETLTIEDAQLVKPNGKRIKPEIVENQIVWTGLEANDVIYYKYKIRSYHEGKFAQEFYDQFVFSGFIPVESAKYSLIVPKDRKIHYETLNGDLDAKITDAEDFRIYQWEKNITTPIKEEPHMPSAVDFATTLHVSTISDWNEIAQWYSDVVYSKIANDKVFEVTEAYDELFGGKTGLTADQKAKIIYDYIAKNISYSSVSFRQSAIIPQKASKTINTRLGDCKDFSTLFVSLANLCGLKSNLVLVSTRDNGKKDMHLPSFLFNHCIVKYFDEKNVEHYLELTDREMPFKSLPSDLYQAVSLTIPAKTETDSKYSLAPIDTKNKTNDRSLSKTKIEIIGNEMSLVSTNVKYGNLSVGLRRKYRSMSQENTVKEMQETYSRHFTTPVKINKVSFIGLEECLDSVSFTNNMTVSSQVKKIGTQSAFSVPFSDVIFTSSPVSLESRKYDFEYWEYETADEYSEQIEILLPADKIFVDIPKSEKLTLNAITYSITYTKVAPNKLLVTRKANISRDNIAASDYPKFKAFVSKIVEIEGAYITFK